MGSLPVFETDIVVAGAGIVGLACARALAMAGHEVLIIEKAGAIGTETSARNSEVIHAGIYYPKGSLKAQACVEGRHRLYDYLATRKVAHKRIGKLIVAATDDQVAELEGIAGKARDNGVDDIAFLSADEAMAMEPALKVKGALLSPSTGILDSHSYMLSLLGEAEDHGASLVLNTAITSGEVLADGRTRLICGGAEPCEIMARGFVNSAGLYAPALASSISGLTESAIPPAFFAKGNYYRLAIRPPFSHLVYPVPVKGGLGVHITLDLGGQARFGPDVEWISDPSDYSVDPRRSDGFYAAVRTYWPGLPDGVLTPDYAGIRPKIAGPENTNTDFVISGPEIMGAMGHVHLFGIESPGLTSSLALAERAAAHFR